MPTSHDTPAGYTSPRHSTSTNTPPPRFLYMTLSPLDAAKKHSAAYAHLRTATSVPGPPLRGKPLRDHGAGVWGFMFYGRWDCEEGLLVMPRLGDEGAESMRWLAREVSRDCFVNIMEQYRPAAHVGRREREERKCMGRLIGR